MANSCGLVLQGEVCGLCGDFDGDGQNDFTTQGQLGVSNPLEFVNSWTVSSRCPDVDENTDPCILRPNRHRWAKMMCSIITGETFKDCHSKVMVDLFLIFHYLKSPNHIQQILKKSFIYLTGTLSTIL